MTDDQRWERWCADFDDVEREVFALFHTRWMWRALTSLMSNGVPDRQYTVVQNYFVRTYVATICSAVRREVDVRRDTTSLARCLQMLISHPRTCSRARYLELAHAAHPDADDRLQQEVGHGFDYFSQPGREFIDSAVVAPMLQRLVDAAHPIKRYTDKVLAHRERTAGDLEPVSTSFEAINTALDELGVVFAWFFRLRHPGSVLGNLTPAQDLQFVSMFQVPWHTPTWTPPPIEDGLQL